MEGFNNGLQYAAEGKSQVDYPHYPSEPTNKTFDVQRAFENVQVPLLQPIADCTQSLNVDRMKELVFPDFPEESDDPNEGGEGVGVEAGATPDE
jgi:hypothetical protein